jgi:DNA-binding NarL/FixJ family response regulator
MSNKITLTPRQSQILVLLSNRGISNKSIAASLKISESTVKTHVGAIMKRYCVQNRTQLVLAANIWNPQS